MRKKIKCLHKETRMKETNNPPVKRIGQPDLPKTKSSIDQKSENKCLE